MPATSHHRPRACVVDARGQASIEHVALVALLALVLGAGASAAAAWAPNLANAVTAGLRRALCVAGGDRCAEAHVARACVVGSGERRQRAEVVVAFRAAQDAALLRESRSDGTVVLTWIDDLAADAVVGAGGRAVLGARERTDTTGATPSEAGTSSSAVVTARGELRAGGSLGARMRWELPSARAADALQRRLARGADELLLLQRARRTAARLAGRGPSPGHAYAVRVGGEGRATGDLALPAEVAGGLEGVIGGAGEVWWDRVRRRATVAVEARGEASASLSGPLGVALGGEVELTPRHELVLDARGRPVSLTVRGRARATARAAGPRIAGRVAAAGADTGERELEARLDLTDPRLGGLVRDALGADGGDRAAAIRALGHALAADAAIDLRRYATSTDRRTWALDGALGAKAGLSMETSRTARRLLDARTRRPGGLWERRLDCGVAARPGDADGADADLPGWIPGVRPG